MYFNVKNCSVLIFICSALVGTIKDSTKAISVQAWRGPWGSTCLGLQKYPEIGT